MLGEQIKRVATAGPIIYFLALTFSEPGARTFLPRLPDPCHYASTSSVGEWCRSALIARVIEMHSAT